MYKICLFGILVTMMKISGSVEEIVVEDDIALEALRANILNLSAYAAQIRKLVEEKTHKQVKAGSIVVALSRLANKVKMLPALRPRVKIIDLAIKAPLCEVSYEKTRDNLVSLTSLRAAIGQNSDFLTITQGVGELTIICSQSLKPRVVEYMKSKPVGQYDELGAITVRFNESEYIEEPNMIYSLISELAKKRINLIEIISTFTELSFVVRKPDIERTVAVFGKFLGG